jgi:pantoate--beta-alanine ligase
MRIVKTREDLAQARANLTGTVGFVPTMGALHEGHEALLARAREENDAVVLSIYVNPTQFNNPDDLANYPSTLEADLEIALEHGVAILFMPEYDTLYPDGFRYSVQENAFANELCGSHRPGHFTGVLTVVMKLLNLVQPDRAYFGEKDYQQYLLIRDMVEAFFLDVDIVACPTVREFDGLAQSSRNLRLSKADRKLAPRLREILLLPVDDDAVAQHLTDAGFRVDYVVTRGGRRFAAASLGRGANEVRLIDNVPAPDIIVENAAA